MIANRSVIVVIPARGGSKGLPGKNMKALLGKPLITWSVEQALACQHVDCTLVTTDSSAIAEAAREAGAQVPFLRPTELAEDGSATVDAVLHALDFLRDKGKDFDIVALLEPTSPLRAPDDLHRSLTTIVENWYRADAVVSLGEIHLENPFIARSIDNHGYVGLLLESEKVHQRQQLPKVFFPYGVIYACKTRVMRETRSFYPPKTLPFYLERWQNYEIDDIYDFACVEAVLRYRKEVCK